MGLFFISFCLVFLTSYLLVGILNKENNILGLIYLFVLSFANIIFTMEFLSLFSAIGEVGILGMNVILFLISLIIWKNFGKPLWKLNYRPFFKRVLGALKKDKSLIILGIGFLVFILSALFLCVTMPVANPDASAYHVLRSMYWISNHNILHFPIADNRNLYMPINSELLYAWILVFLKKELFLSFPAFFGYILSIISVYKVLDLLKYSMRKKLWVIFILSSLAFVIVQASGTETDIIVAGLVASSIVMFWQGIKDRKEIPIAMSALSYAIAIGVKTTAFFAIPSVAIGMVLLSLYYRGKREFYRPLLRFLGYGAIGFIIFSAYNYVLNFLACGNIAGPKEFLLPHQNNDGIKAIPASFIKHLFLYIDFTGFRWGEYTTKYVMHFRDTLINILPIFKTDNGAYTSANVVNQTLLEPLMGPGVLGILVLIPCWIVSLIRPIFKWDKRSFVLGFFGYMWVLNLIVMSGMIQYMTFSVRFLMYLTILSAPILVYSYRKRGIGKFFVILFAMFYLTLVSTNLWARNISKITHTMKAGVSIHQIRNIVSCTSLPPNRVKFTKEQYETLAKTGKCKFINNLVDTIPQKSKVIIFANDLDELLELKLLDFNGYKIDTGLLEHINEFNIEDYDVLITVDNKQMAKVFKNYKKDDKVPIGVNCHYLTNIVINDETELYPTATRCEITPSHFTERGFSLSDKLEYTLGAPFVDDKGKVKDIKWGYIYQKD